MSNWKKYGGIYNLENNNNVSVYSLVADIFTLRQSYYGTFDISGELHVSGNAKIDAKLTGYNLEILNDASINRLTVIGETYNIGNVQVSGNINVAGVIRLKNQLYLGNSGNAYLFGTEIMGNIGVNTTTPIATFDISSTYPLAFNVGTATNEQLNSIPVQNKNNRGILLTANTNASKISFFNDASINLNPNTANGAITYSNGGILTLDVSDNTNILSRLSVSNRSNAITSHLTGETVVIYDTSAGQYLPQIYQNATETTGTALSLVANDSSSNTFMNIITPNKQGVSIGGGVYPNDQTRSMGTIGLRDSSENYTPSINIISGKSNIRNKSTVGINTQAPTTESYVIDTNGPIHMKNGELTITKQSNIEIVDLCVGKNATSKLAAAIGSSYTNSSPYRQKILYTTDGGENWFENYDLSGDSIELKNAKLNAVYVFDSSLTIIAGDYAYAYYTYNGIGISSSKVWQTITSRFNTDASAIIYKIKSIYVTPSKRAFFGIDVSGSNSIMYSFNIPDSSVGFATYINGEDISLNLSFSGIKSFDGVGTTLWVAGTNIVCINTANTTLTDIPTKPGNYNSISVLDSSNIIAAGTNIISFTTNGGTSWTDISLNIPVVVNKIRVLDSSNAIAVCNSGIVLKSLNWSDASSWSIVSSDELNVSGNANRLTDTSYNLTNIGVVDSNNFYITKVIQKYSLTALGNTSIFHSYLPNLFNNVSNYLLDMSGSVRLSGDMNVNDGGKIASNNKTFNLLNNGVNQINFGCDASNVYIGSLQNSTVTVNSNLNVLYESVLNGNLFVKQNGFINANLGVTGNVNIQSNLNVTGNVNIQSNLNVTGNVNIQSNLNVTGNVNIQSNLNVTGNANIGGTLTVTGNTFLSNLVVNANANIFGNANLGGTLVVTGNTFLSNLVVNANANIFGNANVGGTLTVTGNTFLSNLVVNANANIFGNANIGGTLTVTGNTFLSNLVVNANANIFGNANIGGTLVVTGNTFLSNLVVNANANIFGNANIGGTLTVTGNTFLSNLVVNANANIFGNANIGGTLTVTGNTFLSNLVVNANANIFGNANIGGTLTVTGNTFLSNLVVNANANIFGNANIGGTLVVTGNTFLSNLVVNANANIFGNANIGGTLTVTGNTFLSNLVVNANANIFGNANIGGTLTVTGNTFLSNLVVNANANIFGNANIGGTLVVTGNTFLSNLVVNANANIFGNANIGGTLTVTGNTFLSNLVVNANLSIGTSPATGYVLTVSGGIQATSYNATSDRRLKSNIQILSNQSKYILDIVPVTFDWKVDGKHDIGFIAQDVFKTYPELLPIHLTDPSLNRDEPTDPCGNPLYYAMDYGRMTPFLWQGMREIIQRLEALESENRILKSRIEILELTRSGPKR